MTVPNLITSLRIILTPIFIIYLIDDKTLPALIVFTIAGLSDAADGFIARVFNQKSKLGAILDPIADKLLLVTAFVMLSVKDFVPSWLTVIVISRDLLILLAVLILFLSKENVEMRPAFISKITTCLQLATVFNVLFADYFPDFHQFSIYLFWATGLMSVTSFLHYLRQWFRIMGEDQPTEGG
ncbi:MAG: CDP-alcohol phosphatidyltransferase family protein [Deltaproteobacteria bacterium]|nr:CDP-alcohol phosphatidyltransferase family protein [Deltaproteobacteria bacterium]